MSAPKQKFHDPRDVYIPGSTENNLSKEECEHMKVCVFRRWPPFLSGAEKAIINFIYDRTIHYQHRWAYVSIDTLVKGYPLRDYRTSVNNLYDDPKFYQRLTAMERAFIDEGNVFLTAPTGLSRRQVIISLDQLEKAGFIFRIRNGENPEMSLNPDANYSYIKFILNKKTK